MFRWIYRMGAAHENERIRLLVAVFTLESSQEIGWLEGRLIDKRGNVAKQATRLSELKAAQNLLDRLMQPRADYAHFDPAPIDLKDLLPKEKK